MRVIKPGRVREYATAYPNAKSALERWLAITTAGNWANLIEVRRTFPSADAVTVASKRTVVVFNIGGNDYRLVAAIHYDTGKVFVLRFLTHAEYSKDEWKGQL